MKNNTNEKEFLNTILSDTSEEESLVHKIKIVGPWPDDYGIYYYYYQINGRARPTYFAIKDKNILWFIPLSSKVDKYQVIIDKKLKNMVVVNQL